MGGNNLHADEVNCLKAMQQCLNQSDRETKCDPFKETKGWTACYNKLRATTGIQCTEGCKALEEANQCGVNCNGMNVQSQRDCIKSIMNVPSHFINNCGINFTESPQKLVECVDRYGNSEEKQRARNCAGL
jgi:hypothetical protein